VTKAEPIIASNREIDLISARLEKIYDLLRRLRVIFDNENTAVYSCHSFHLTHVDHRKFYHKLEA
jgi:acetolactate synthase regulatory subunit